MLEWFDFDWKHEHKHELASRVAPMRCSIADVGRSMFAAQLA
jgi:hypothetical protein